MTEQVIGTAYLTTLQGICKIVELIASFIAVLLVGIKFAGSKIDFFVSASCFSIISAALLLALYVSAAVAKITLPWNRIQFFFHVVLAIYYIIAAGLILDYADLFDRLLAGGIFAIIAVIAHLVDAFDNYKKSPLH